MTREERDRFDRAYTDGVLRELEAGAARPSVVAEKVHRSLSAGVASEYAQNFGRKPNDGATS